ncbi:hypothetical protein M9458_055436 [Cirrhinus mrigala]|uniref:Envelope protein n=1 Tax=Cirrhinus mrigala TaxID=683832 RepID=A0ABD0MKA9_CIRMR
MDYPPLESYMQCSIVEAILAFDELIVQLTKEILEGTDPRFQVNIVERIIWKDRKTQHMWLLKVTIYNVKYTDAGIYYCAWARETRDAYQEVQINVIHPEPDLTIREAMKGLFPNPVRAAKAKCEGNYACALALLQRSVLRNEVEGEYWICMQLQSVWKTQQITSEMLYPEKNKCDMPRQMTVIMQMADNIRANRALRFALKDYNCSYPGLPFKGPAFQVQSHLTDLCICATKGKHYVGMSDCRTTITVNKTVQSKSNCTVRYQNGTTEDFGCPFSHLDSAPGMIWTCGGMAYYHLDEGDWRGCCYPALLSTGTTVLVKRDSETIMGNAVQQTREKRDVNSMPNRYNGYKTVDPWTTPGENIGWSLAGFFTGVGTTVALNKINGLAWQVLSLENDTAHALGLITDELKKMREAVIQNRLVLDLLTSEKRGVCKMLGVSSCFYIPDNSDNITDILTHMRESIPEPRKDDSWFSWLDSLWGGWGTWIFTTVVPIIVLLLIVLLIAPCLIQCINNFIVHTIASLTTRGTYQVMLSAQQEGARPPAPDPRPNNEPDKDDYSSYAHVYQLELEGHYRNAESAV